jgi:hypothetical protein
MSTRTIKEYKRAAYERLAQQYEKFGRSGPGAGATEFTCLAISDALKNDWCPNYSERDAYRRVFDFAAFGQDGSSNEKYLWARSDKTATNLRVLMLCFCAAMVATGDL